MRYLRLVGATLVLFAASLDLTVGAQPSTELSGTITTTLDLTRDARLVGDVTCAVTGAPCIRIAASGVALRLEGFSITGQADPLTGCSGSSTANEHGIAISGQRGVDIRGPGLMVAVEFNRPGTGEPDAAFANAVRERALEKGLILLTCGVNGNVIRFLPPLTVQDEVFAEALGILESAMIEAG